MASSNPGSNLEVVEAKVTLANIEVGLAGALNEEVSPLSMLGEVGDGSASYRENR